MCALQAVIPPAQQPSDAFNRRRRVRQKRSRRRTRKHKSSSVLDMIDDINEDDGFLMGSVNGRSARLRSTRLSPSRPHGTQSRHTPRLVRHASPQSDTGDDDQRDPSLYGTSMRSRRSLKSMLSRQDTPIIGTRSNAKQSAMSSQSQASDFDRRTRAMLA